MKNKKQTGKQDDELDNVTIADMNVDGMPWYQSPEERKKRSELREVSMTKEERRAAVKGAYAAFLPIFLVTLGVICLAFGLIMLYFYLVM